MSRHPFRDVAIAGVHNTEQARVLEGHDSLSIAFKAARGVLAETGIDPTEIDAVVGSNGRDIAYMLGIGPVVCIGDSAIPGVIEAASMVASGICSTVLVADGGAGIYKDRAATAPWTRPTNEFVLSHGVYTAVEFALIARYHMETYGTTPEQLATVASTIRNNGSAHPDAVYSGRGPYTAEDVLASRMVADPFHLLDCSMTAEGGGALLLTTAARARDTDRKPVFILGAGLDTLGPAYKHAPSWDLVTATGAVNGQVGREGATKAFLAAGLKPTDVDVCELYDPFSFEIIRQLEAFGFCAEGEGGPFVMDGKIAPGGTVPVTTDGGTMSFGHGGGMVQMLQRVTRGVEQLQGDCKGVNIPDAEVALCSNGGAGALFSHVVLLGSEQP
jgi:acetyl-CoA acetyltransferase